MKNKLFSLYAISLCNLVASDQPSTSQKESIAEGPQTFSDFMKQREAIAIKDFKEKEIDAFLKQHQETCTELQNQKTFTPEKFNSEIYNLKNQFETKETELLESLKVKRKELSSILESVSRLNLSSISEQYYGHCNIQPMPENCLLAKKMAKAKEMEDISESIGRLRTQYIIDITEMIKSAPINLTNLAAFLLHKDSKEAASFSESEIEVKK